MLTVGLLTPRSTLYPNLSTDWLQSMKANLHRDGKEQELKFIYENIGFGIQEQEIYTRTEKLLLQDEADLVILFAEPGIGQLLAPLFNATGKLLLLVNFGANFPENWQPAPSVFTHSLNFCFQAGLTGQLAATQSGVETANVISYYDGGYRQCFSMLYSHQQHGGIPQYNYITSLRTAEFTLAPLTAYLEEHPEIRTLLCLFSGDQSERFLEEAVPAQEKMNLNLFGSPMLFDGQIVQGDQQKSAVVRGYIPWHASLDNEGNRSFLETLGKSGPVKANYFSLLGWETGLLIQLVLSHPETRNGAALAELIQKEKPVSPRGQLFADIYTQHSYTIPLLARRNSDFSVELEGTLTDVATDWTGFTHIKLGPGENSSWRNTYLCI